MKVTRLLTTFAVLTMGFINHTHAENINPLAQFIGIWEGDQGMDISPAQKETGAPGSPAASPFYERMEISAGPVVTNASEQDLVALTIHQKVFRKSNQKQFHDQIGYLIWDKNSSKIIYSFCIPRGVCISAEGAFNGVNELSVSTDSAIAETEFMRKNASTQRFSLTMKIDPDKSMSYSQMTALNIYGNPFAHVDSNTLKRVANQDTQKRK